MTCRDCIHYDICLLSHEEDDYKKCFHFKNKADVVEVVRCKDCELYSGKYCRLTDDTEDRREPDDYCSYGTPKERSDNNG